jgi:cyanophycinase-like exopeptidase
MAGSASVPLPRPSAGLRPGPAETAFQAEYLGIGLDEATAIVVQGQIADVIGTGKAHFYDANRKVEKGQPDHEARSAGQRYDLKERKSLAVEK